MRERIKDVAAQLKRAGRSANHGGLSWGLAYVAEFELLKGAAQATGEWKAICEENGWKVDHDAWSHMHGVAGVAK